MLLSIFYPLIAVLYYIAIKQCVTHGERTKRFFFFNNDTKSKQKGQL
jgi:hypothetical protein